MATKRPCSSILADDIDYSPSGDNLYTYDHDGEDNVSSIGALTSSSSKKKRARNTLSQRSNDALVNNNNNNNKNNNNNDVIFSTPTKRGNLKNDENVFPLRSSPTVSCTGKSNTSKKGGKSTAPLLYDNVGQFTSNFNFQADQKKVFELLLKCKYTNNPFAQVIIKRYSEILRVRKGDDPQTFLNDAHDCRAKLASIISIVAFSSASQIPRPHLVRTFINDDWAIRICNHLLRK
jgi:Tfp pilus assembly protein PilW